MAGLTDIRVMIPRVRRALVAPADLGLPELTDDEVKDAIADACSEIALYCGSLFGHQIVVTATDEVTNYPREYATTEPLELDEQAAVALQAALNRFFMAFGLVKVSERIGDESSTWEYTLSASMLRDQLKALQDARDRALTAIEERAAGLVGDYYVSLIAARDIATARMIEPGPGGGIGQEVDIRFAR